MKQEPVAWYRDEDGIRIYYETKVWDDCTPLYTTPQPKQEQGEPVALKKGECWPKEVMRQWDYWRKEIANGHKGSAPRDWFEGLSEIKLIDTTPQRRTWVGLTYKDMVSLQKDLYDAKGEVVLPTTFAKAVEAKLKEKNT